MQNEDYSKDGDLAKQLRAGVKTLAVPISQYQTGQLLKLLETLYKWNKAYNLTAIKRPKEGLSLHILDSLTLFARFQQIEDNQKILDVGTGAGFPGLPLAILYPNLKFTLLDSNSKKIRFIRQVAFQLGLKNVEPLHARVESIKDRKFDVITSRAFASTNDMLALTSTLLAKTGVWLAMKGEFSESEKVSLPTNVVSQAITPVEIPGVYADRCIVELSNG